MGYKKFIISLINRFAPDLSNEAKETDGESLLKRTQIFANIIVLLQVVSVFIALTAFIFSIISTHRFEKQTKRIEKNKNAVEAVKNIYNETFLQNYTTYFDHDSVCEETRQPFFYILNTYYVTAIIYNSNIADKDIIEKAIKQGVFEFKTSVYYDKIKESGDFKTAISEINQMTKEFKDTVITQNDLMTNEFKDDKP